MVWEVIFCIALVFLILASWILPWISLKRISSLDFEVDILKQQIHKILVFLKKEGVDLPESVIYKAENYEYEQETHEYQNEENDPNINPVEAKIENPSIFYNVDEKPKNKDSSSFEQKFGAQLPVWIGAIALALAGFFMVKYSIENELLSPKIRLLAGAIFGISMIFASSWLHQKKSFANGLRISQALAGAGIIDLYICVYAATNVFSFMPIFVGFLLMASITAITIILSLRYGNPIALLGLIGGFLAPIMLNSESAKTPILLIYLYFVVAGLMLVIRRQSSWIIAVPTVIGAFSWAGFGALCSNAPNVNIYLSLFLIAISATVIVTSQKQYREEISLKTNKFYTISIVNYLSLSGTILLVGSIIANSGFGFIEWGLFSLISLATIILAFFDQKLYGIGPWISMSANLIILLVWNNADANSFAIIIGIFAAIYIGSAYLLQSSSQSQVYWAALSSASSILYFFLAYYKLRNSEVVSSIDMFWGVLALVFCLVKALMLLKIMKKMPENEPFKQLIMTIYAATSTLYLSTALTIELTRESLPVAFATQLFAISWINTKANIRALRYLAGVITLGFTLIILPEVLTTLYLIYLSLFKIRIDFSNELISFNNSIFLFALPAIFFICSSYLLRMQKDDKFVRALEVASVVLLGVTGYYTRYAIYSDKHLNLVAANFLDRGIASNVLFLSGCLCFWIGKNYTRQAITLSGSVIYYMTIFRIIYFDFIVYNPLFSKQAVGSLPIINALLITYGLPIAWILSAIRKFKDKNNLSSNYIYSFILLLAFALISLNIRQLFHGNYLSGNETSNAEVYSYSLAWLMFGIMLLFFGTIKKDKMVRIASLVIMILTIGKVFIFDASALEGLFRVFSFFGLGLSLLGLSWFYTKFVFGKENLLDNTKE